MIEENLERICQKIKECERACGRAEGSVRLMAVSKLHTYEDMLAAYGWGQRLFGENHVQEVEKKIPTERPEGMEVHLIGHLQSNKVRKIVPHVQAIDSVDSIPLLDKINNAAIDSHKNIDILFEYNTSGEAQKSGFVSQDDLFDAIDHLSEMENVRVRGLMTVGPLGGDESQVRSAFRTLRQLRDTCQSRYPQFDFSTLSMGMSGDFKIAIEEGSTMVRIGTSIFGPRNYQL